MQHERYLAHRNPCEIYSESQSMIEYIDKNQPNVIAGHGMRTGLRMMADGQDHAVYRLYEPGDKPLPGLYVLVLGAFQPL